jgi:hypothetical protein
MEHIKLLQSSYFDFWNSECGGIHQDTRRPYGNSDHLKDICEILKIDRKLDVGASKATEDICWDGKQEKELEQFHRELPVALTIILKTKSFKPGLYQADRDEENWKWVKK